VKKLVYRRARLYDTVGLGAGRARLCDTVGLGAGRARLCDTVGLGAGRASLRIRAARWHSKAFILG
jgi:hypothetical protein